MKKTKKKDNSTPYILLIAGLFLVILVLIAAYILIPAPKKDSTPSTYSSVNKW